MLTVLGSPRRLCDGWTRRETLQAGALSLLGGLSLAELLHAESAPSRPAGKAKHVLVVNLLGGAATQDMFDLKPSAPREIRGEFNPIRTSVTGLQISEHLPRLARWMHRCGLVRSVTHKAGCHNPLPSYTGSEVPPPDIISTRDTYPPSFGSVCEWLRQQDPARRRRELPDYIYLPCPLGWGQAIRRPGPWAGFLGQTCDALYTEVTPYLDPGRKCLPGQPQFVRGQPRLPEGTLGITLDRFNDRRRLLYQFDRALKHAEAHTEPGRFGRQQQRAFQLLTSPAVRSAFDLDREPPALRDRYGRTVFGSSTLMARRLIEAGVREMGRTPRVNANGGRDHWTHCYSVLLAGAGLRGGTVVGASDAQAAYVKDRPIRPADLIATVYSALGIDPELLVPDRAGRPHHASQGGHPIRELLA